MRLALINDLPLFIDGVASLEGALERHVARLGESIPAQLRYYSFVDFVTAWSQICSDCQAHVLVGQRPQRLRAHGAGPTAGAIFEVAPRRNHDAAGHTSGVEVGEPADWSELSRFESICVLDDVAMFGETLLSVLSLVQRSTALGSTRVNVAFSTPRALQTVKRSAFGVEVRCARLLDFEPISGGTAIFLWDLLFGRLRDVPFLQNEALLKPFFGDERNLLLGLQALVSQQRQLPVPRISQEWR